MSTARRGATRLAFTKRAIEALERPPTGRIDVYDTVQPGLSLRVSAAGARTFSVHGRAKGGQVERVTLGPYPNVSIEDARRRAAEIVAGFANGVSKAEQLRRDRAQKTLDELAKAYFADRESEGKKSVGDMRMGYELYLGTIPAARKKHGRVRVKPAGSVDWSRRKPYQIAPDDVTRLRADLAQSSGRTSANRVMQLFRAIINFGREHGYVERDHAEALVGRVKLFSEQSRTRRLSADELRSFFATLGSERNGDFREFLEVLLFTGARRSNVLAMRWDELDLDARTWEIPAGKAKSGQAMAVPLAAGALDVLRRRAAASSMQTPARSPWVFPADSASGHMEAPKKPWAAFRARAGLADVRMHDLRRTLGSWMIDTGAPIAVIGKQLGHRDPKSTNVYARLDLEPVRHALERAAAAIQATTAAAADAEVVPLTTSRKTRHAR